MDDFHDFFLECFELFCFGSRELLSGTIHMAFEHEEIGGFEESDSGKILLDNRKAIWVLCLDEGDKFVDACSCFLERYENFLLLGHRIVVLLV